MEADEELKREIQRRLHALLTPLYHHPTYFPGGQPISFTATHLRHNLLHTDYYVCEKSDGVRYLLYFAQPPGGIAAFLIDRNWRVLVFPGFGMMTRELDSGRLLGDTLIDGELIEADNTFLMFDCLLANGQPVWRLELPERLAKLQNHVMFPYQHMLKSVDGYSSEAPFKLRLKQQFKSYGIAELLDHVIPNQQHPNDGLIFTPVKEPYKAGTWHSLLKWKPAEWNTVDFLVNISDQTDQTGQIVSLQLNKHGRPEHYTTSADPNLRPHANKIVECRLANGEWTFVRVRHDKHHPNDRAVAEKVIDSIKDDVRREDLVKALEAIRSNWKAREASSAVCAAVPAAPAVSQQSRVQLQWKSFEDYDSADTDHAAAENSAKRAKSDVSEREQDGEETSEAPLEYNI